MEIPKYSGNTFECFDQEMYRDGGSKITAAVVRRPPEPGEIILQDDRLQLTKEYRYEIGEHDFRLTGGKVYDSREEYRTALKAGVDIMEAAKAGAIKEAVEEAGVKVKDITFLNKSICGMTVIWDLYYFLVKDFSEDVQHLEEDEDVEINWVSKEKAREMCLNGEMKEGRSALVLLKFLENKL